MKTEITTLLVYKAVIFTGVLFQIDTTFMLLGQIDPIAGLDIYKVVSNFGIVGFLILAIRYFISESKRMQKEFAQERSKQDESHKEEKIKLIEFHEKENQLQALKIENLQEEVLVLKVKIAKDVE